MHRKFLNQLGKNYNNNLLLIQTVMLEKTLESLLDCKEIQSVHYKGDQSWVFFGRNDAKAKIPVLGHLL